MSRLEGEDGEVEEITLIKAAKEGDFDKLLKCLRAGADANQRDAKGRTPPNVCRRYRRRGDYDTIDAIRCGY